MHLIDPQLVSLAHPLLSLIPSSYFSRIVFLIYCIIVFIQNTHCQASCLCGRQLRYAISVCLLILFPYYIILHRNSYFLLFLQKSQAPLQRTLPTYVPTMSRIYSLEFVSSFHSPFLCFFGGEIGYKSYLHSLLQLLACVYFSSGILHLVDPHAACLPGSPTIGFSTYSSRIVFLISLYQQNPKLAVSDLRLHAMPYHLSWVPSLEFLSSLPLSLLFFGD